MRQQGQNPLEQWIAAKTGGDMRAYQLAKIRETLDMVTARSDFYRERYQGLPFGGVKSFADFEKLPFVTAEDLVKDGPRMLCVPQNEIERIVTLQSSGTTGKPKRVYFTEADQALSVDFFHHGMRCLVDETDRCAILLPYQSPGSAGDLLARGLRRTGCGVYPYGLIEDCEAAGRFIKQNEITSLVGNPVQVLKLAETMCAGGLAARLRSVLLSTDYVPDAIGTRLAALWGCAVYEHYGMTEMCFGGGVYCSYLRGYHLREADLYFEIVSESGAVLPDGAYGEIVFTTLTRTGMPLLRYRTGDYGRFKKERCACSGTLKLMEKIKRRVQGGVSGANGKRFYLCDFDEIIFAEDGVGDYRLAIGGGDLKTGDGNLAVGGDMHIRLQAVQGGALSGGQRPDGEAEQAFSGTQAPDGNGAKGAGGVCGRIRERIRAEMGFDPCVTLEESAPPGNTNGSNRLSKRTIEVHGRR